MKKNPLDFLHFTSTNPKHQTQRAKPLDFKQNHRFRLNLN